MMTDTVEWISVAVAPCFNVNGVYGFGFDELKVRVHNKKQEPAADTENQTADTADKE